MKPELEQYRREISSLQKLWAEHLASGIDFCLALREFERSDVWKYGGHDTFQECLIREFPNSFSHLRYGNVMRAIEEWGVDRVRQLGIESAHALILNQAVLKSPEKKAAAGQVFDHCLDRDGCPPGPKKVREILDHLAPEGERPPKDILDARRADRQKEEITRLKGRIQELEMENQELKTELERVNGLLHAKKARRLSPEKAA